MYYLLGAEVEKFRFDRAALRKLSKGLGAILVPGTSVRQRNVKNISRQTDNSQRTGDEFRLK
jgi:hypothetical protein